MYRSSWKGWGCQPEHISGKSNQSLLYVLSPLSLNYGHVFDEYLWSNYIPGIILGSGDRAENKEAKAASCPGIGSLAGDADRKPFEKQ